MPKYVVVYETVTFPFIPGSREILRHATHFIINFINCTILQDEVCTPCGPKVLGLIFLKIEDTYLFLFQNRLHWHIYRLLCGCTVSEKLLKNSSFWTFFNSSVTASWISATSAKWNPFNCILN